MHQTTRSGNEVTLCSYATWKVDTIRSFMARPFVRNVALLASGTAVAQIISILAAPVIARIYGPPVFGLYSVLMSVVGIIGPAATLSYASAIVLPKTDDDAIALFHLSLVVGLGIALVTFLAFVYWHGELSILMGFSATSSLPFFVPLMLITYAINEPAQQWLVRKKKFKIISQVAAIGSVLGGAAKIIVGLSIATASALIIATTLAAATTCGIFLARTVGVREISNGYHVSMRTDWSKIASVFGKYHHFAVYRAPQVLISNASQSLPIVLLGALYGPAYAGFYSVARLVLSAPSMFFGSALSSVLLLRYAEAANQDELLRPLVEKSTLYLAGNQRHSFWCSRSGRALDF